MRKLIFGSACSVDQFIAREGGGIDWLMWSEQAIELSAASWKKLDCVLMGRNTFEAAIRHGQNPAMPGMAIYVASTTLRATGVEGCSISSRGVTDAVRSLKHGEGKDICLMGGGQLANSLFEHGLIEVLEINVYPLLLGSGIPLFGPLSRQLSLELRDSRSLTNGCLFHVYDVKN